MVWENILTFANKTLFQVRFLLRHIVDDIIDLM